MELKKVEIDRFDLKNEGFKFLVKQIEKVEEQKLSNKYMADLLTLLNKLKEEEVQVLLKMDTFQLQKLAILLTKMDFENGSCGLSFFRGKIYGFTKFGKKNYVMKYPNYSIEF